MTWQCLKVELIKLIFDVKTSVKINLNFKIIKPSRYFIENVQGNVKTTIHKNCLKIKISNYVRLVKSIPNYKTFIYKFKISILTLISFIKEVYFIKLTNKNYH